MADPVTGALIAQGIAGGAKAVGAMGQARAERRAARNNAYVAETRAMQTGTDAAMGLADELAEALVSETPDTKLSTLFVP